MSTSSVRERSQSQQPTTTRTNSHQNHTQASQSQAPARSSDRVSVSHEAAPFVPDRADREMIRRNIEEARSLRHADESVRLAWFHTQIRNRGRQDYKQRTPTAERPFSYNERLGNYNFGVLAAAAGLDERMARAGAGRAQVTTGSSQPRWGTAAEIRPTAQGYRAVGGSGSLGDDPADQALIHQGAEEARRYLRNESTPNLGTRPIAASRGEAAEDAAMAANPLFGAGQVAGENSHALATVAADHGGRLIHNLLHRNDPPRTFEGRMNAQLNSQAASLRGPEARTMVANWSFRHDLSPQERLSGLGEDAVRRYHSREGRPLLFRQLMESVPRGDQRQLAREIATRLSDQDVDRMGRTPTGSRDLLALREPLARDYINFNVFEPGEHATDSDLRQLQRLDWARHRPENSLERDSAWITAPMQAALMQLAIQRSLAAAR